MELRICFEMELGSFGILVWHWQDLVGTLRLRLIGITFGAFGSSVLTFGLFA
jgi:hypothetical protein